MTTPIVRRLGLLALAAASVCSASYHFIHYTTRTAPWQGIPEKFDVNALPAKTLSYFLSDQSGVQLAPSDSYAGFISQVRAAADVWNGVETSELRLSFGGFAPPNSPQSTPAMDIVFEDLAPGLIAAGTPTVRSENNGNFVPVLRSVVMLSPDLRNHPTFGESMFGTLVHEIGHALGLQHTFTSGVMSTAITRTTSRAKPLTADDIAAISLLYPTPAFLQTTGSISGRVTMQGTGVSLASVVAISPSGAAVSTLTNPDGTYRIDGIPPRSYFIYVHPLPPRRQGQATPGDVVYPVDPDKREFAPSGPFNTIFFPGTNDPSRAVTVFPAAGQVVENVNFAVTPRTGYGINSVDTRTFHSRVAVKPPYLSPNMTYPFIVASGSGLINGSAPAPGLSVSVLGGATLSTKPYVSAPTTHIQIDFDVRTLGFVNDSARHLVFSQGGDIYVLPAAFFHVDSAPPSIASVVPAPDTNGQRRAIVTGTSFNEGSRVFFDGVPATVREFDRAAGRIVVDPPVAAPNHRASVIVLNPDGQSSLFIEGDTPSSYTYLSEGTSITTPAPSLQVSPNTLVAGSEGMVQIDVTGGSLSEGQVSLGFGSSDIVVKRLAVVSPTRLLANIAVGASAQAGFPQVSIVSGLQLLAQPFALQVLPPARVFSLNSKIRNDANSNAGLSPGSRLVLTVNQAPASLSSSNFVLYLDGQAIPATGISETELTFELPNTTSVGPVVLQVEMLGERSLPILMIVEPPPPKILSAEAGLPTASGPADGAASVHPGQLLTVTVEDLADPGNLPAPDEVSVNLGGVPLRVAQILAKSDVHQVIAIVSDLAPSGDEVPLTISIGTRTSDPVSLAVEAGQ